MDIRVVIVDGRTLCRYGLARIADDHPDVVLVGQMPTAADALARLPALEPDVAVVSTALPDGDGLALTRTLRERRTGMGVVVIGSSVDDGPLFHAMEARASAYVATSAPAGELVAAIRHAAVAPGSFTASGLAAALARRRTGDLLSPREREALTLLTRGMSIAQIARAMHLSHSTAKTYTARLYEKLGAANRAQMLMAALRLGLIRQDDPAYGPGPVVGGRLES